MIGTITINDQIGAYEKPDKTLGGVTLLGVLQQFKALPQGTRIVNVNIASPGGLVDEGNNIYDYLLSEKKNYVINTVQVGDIASIATKLFLAGDSRTGDPKFDFMIHNPWNDPGAGDSNYQAAMLESLLRAESELRKFYSKELNITEEGLAPLMDAETSLTGEQRLSLGFATQLKNSNVMAMKKPGEKSVSLSEKIAALYKKATGKDIKAKGENALDVQLMPGQPGAILTIDAPNEDSLVGASAMLDGKPAPDGDYVAMPDAEDGASPMGDTITVKDGVVTAVTEPAGADPNAKEINAKVSGLEEAVGKLTDSVSALIESMNASETKAVETAVAQAETKAEARIMALKNEIGTVHTPKRASVNYAQNVNPDAVPFKSLAERLKEKEEARKNKMK